MSPCNAFIGANGERKVSATIYGRRRGSASRLATAFRTRINRKFTPNQILPPFAGFLFARTRRANGGFRTI
ncbi:hypothetical protein B2M20_11905 [Nitrobacter vulgaris]|uniref:Uncharacterized protein n=1 Tax=Nitrobacter vulgaris TaxID=29421 RepID=A0A1V4HXC0_NITVU|nr:hypothetical protein B2M20_11905 [Nitrobacter vulgaris]